jgi:Rad3-related DNA helicase
MTPNDYDLPHDEWRPGQKDSIDWVLDGKGEMNILESPTGTGKTAVSKAVASSSKDQDGCSTIALMRTKFLQRQYEDDYGFLTQFGKSEYPCVHKDGRKPKFTASECLHTSPRAAHFSEGPNGKRRCYRLEECPYLLNLDMIQVERGRGVAMNYAVWAHEAKNYHPTWLICDEAHQIPDEVIEWAGLTVTQRNMKDFPLPRVPEIKNNLSDIDKRSSVLSWLDKSEKVLDETRKEEIRNSLRYGDKKKHRHIFALGNLLTKIRQTRTAMQNSRFGWFIQSDHRLGRLARSTPVLVCKPLSASFHFQSWVESAESILLMSATIGNPDTFAGELGIEKPRVRISHSPWPVERRPVYDLGAPPLNYESPDHIRNLQALKIKNAINEVPDDWCGLIHVTSKNQAADLGRRLIRLGLGNRIWMPPIKERVSTDKQIRLWEEVKRSTPGALAITWAFHEGFNALRERINVVTKIPYPYIGADYEKARLDYSVEFYYQRTAWGLTQMLGRTRRGREEDYDTEDERRGLVLIADGNWRKVKDWIPGDVSESIRGW